MVPRRQEEIAPAATRALESVAARAAGDADSLGRSRHPAAAEGLIALDALRKAADAVKSRLTASAPSADASALPGSSE